MAIEIKHLDKDTTLTDAFSVRERVFHDEQGIPTSDDFDGQDYTAEQFVAYDDGLAIGTGRYRVLSDNIGKVERVAVLEDYRGQHVGQAIMGKIAEQAKEQGLSQLALDAQMTAASFYENLGYQPVGDVFEEVGIPHIKMVLNLTQ